MERFRHQSSFQNIHSPVYEQGLHLPSEPPYEAQTFQPQTVVSDNISIQQQTQIPWFMFVSLNEVSQSSLEEGSIYKYVHVQSALNDQTKIDDKKKAPLKQGQENKQHLLPLKLEKSLHDSSKVIEIQSSQSSMIQPQINVKQIQIAKRQQQSLLKLLQQAFQKLQVYKKKRYRNDNNIYKKFITYLSKILRNKFPSLNYNINKGKDRDGIQKTINDSKEAFIKKLMDIEKYGKDFLPLVKQKFDKYLQGYFFTDLIEPTPADIYLQSLVPYYKKAFELYLEGKRQQSFRCIYEIKGFKQTKKRDKGLEQIEKYRMKLGL